MALIPTLVHLCAPWASFYRDSKVAEIGVEFAHIGGLVLSGGIAVAVDRASMRVIGRPAEERRVHLRELAAVHRPVIIGLVVVTLSGLLLLAADVETYATSVAFWIKMGLIVLLTANGLAMQASEKRLGRNVDDMPAWMLLRRTSWASRALWLLITLVGVVLVNAA
jgi:hypothetical protein